MSNKRVTHIVNRYIHQHDRQQVDAEGYPKGNGKYSRDGHTYVEFTGSSLWHHDTHVAEQYVTRDGGHIVIMRMVTKIIPKYGVYGYSGIIDGVRGSKTTKELLCTLRNSVPGSITAICVPCKLDSEGEHKPFSKENGLFYVMNTLHWIQMFMMEGKHRRKEEMEDLILFSRSLRTLINLTAEAEGKPDVESSSVSEYLAILNGIWKEIDAYYARKSVAGVACTGYIDYHTKYIQHVSALGRLESTIKNIQIELDNVRHSAYAKVFNKNKVESMFQVAKHKWVAIVDKYGKEAAENVCRAIHNSYVSNALSNKDSKYESVRKFAEICRGNYSVPSAIVRAARTGPARVCGESFAYSMFSCNPDANDLLFLARDKNGERKIVTSRGVEISRGKNMVQKVAAMAELILAGHDLTGRKVSCYTIEKCDEEYVKVGCHVFRMATVKTFAKMASLPDDECESLYLEMCGIGDTEIAIFNELVGLIATDGECDPIHGIRADIACRTKELSEKLLSATEEKNKFLAEVAERTKKYQAAKKAASRKAKKAA